MKSLTARLLDALYPPGLVCWACNLECETEALGLCPECAGQLRPAPPQPPPRGLLALQPGVFYDPVLRDAMHRFKYNRQSWLADHFAALMPDLSPFPATAAVPVPLWPRREELRGYNQSALLGEKALRLQGLSLPMESRWLVRTRDTGSQTALSAPARQENMENAFRASEAVRGHRILLIDDVTTTGSTLSACADALLAAGAAGVYAAVACITPGDGQQES